MRGLTIIYSGWYRKRGVLQFAINGSSVSLGGTGIVWGFSLSNLVTLYDFALGFVSTAEWKSPVKAGRC